MKTERSCANGPQDLKAGGDGLIQSYTPMKDPTLPKWRRMLARELRERSRFESLSVGEWRSLLETRSVTSSNHDTVLSLDWPHYCAGASQACGGPRGWCYTFTGLQAGENHVRKVAMVDALATLHPALFAERVVLEVERAVRSGALPYANLRYSGSGELNACHVKGLALVATRGVRLWGFTRNLVVASALRAAEIPVIVSYDRSTVLRHVLAARRKGFPLGYSSEGVDDGPPHPSVVVFPVHRSGRIPEVVDVPELCPKVVHEYLHQERPPAMCQSVCQRCHQP